MSRHGCRREDSIEVARVVARHLRENRKRKWLLKHGVLDEGRPREVFGAWSSGSHIINTLGRADRIIIRIAEATLEQLASEHGNKNRKEIQRVSKTPQCQFTIATSHLRNAYRARMNLEQVKW